MDTTVREADDILVAHSASCGEKHAKIESAREAGDMIQPHLIAVLPYVAPPELAGSILTTHPQLALWATNMPSASRTQHQLRFPFDADPLTLHLSGVIEITRKFSVNHRGNQGHLAVPTLDYHRQLPIFPNSGRDS